MDSLIKMFSRLPGLGPKSAKRVVLHLLNNRDDLMNPLAKKIQEVSEEIIECEECGNFDMDDICGICRDDKRDKTSLCIIEGISDLWALEKGGLYNGLYYVLGGVLSAIDGVTPRDIRLDGLKKKIQNSSIAEVIIATNATLEGQTTAHYIHELIRDSNVIVSRLANGVPMGGEIDYLDEGTLRVAFSNRKLI